ncbi:MAG TPA: copper chaperone [Candidatus Scalindua sp.]|nr:copper chaperone [Candidatus Scalindua sp.]
MKTTIKSVAISISMLIIALFATTYTINAQDTTDTVYIKIMVDGLSCPFCAYGLEKKLKQVAGSKDVFIKLAEGEATMSVPKGKEPTKEELETIVKDAGFTPREITFSDKPFKTKEDE